MKKFIVGHSHARFLADTLLAALLCLGSASSQEMRTWIDNQGRKVEAALVRVNETSVAIRLKDGREMDFPIARLSAADAKYVGEFSETSKKEATPSSAKPERNFDLPWPDRVSFKEDPEIVVIEENADGKRFVYESANFRYVSDVRLATSVVRGFARLFDTTNLFCHSLPLGFNGGTKTDGKYQILLFENFDDYVTNGGPPASAGVFMGGRHLIMVPLTSLGVRPVGSGYMLDRDKSSKTLPHEITHQLTPGSYYRKGSLGWFTEGIAEYVAVTPYRAGSYNVRSNLKPIVEFVTSFSKDYGSGRNLGTEIKLPPLEQFFMQDYNAFLADPQRNYGSAALLVYYFFHFDGEGDAKRIKAFLKALHDGKQGKEALEVLLDGRSYKQLEQEIQKAWGRKGVDFTFGDG